MSIKIGKNRKPAILSPSRDFAKDVSQFSTIPEKEKAYEPVRSTESYHPSEVIKFQPDYSVPFRAIPPEPSRQRAMRHASFDTLRLNPNLVLGIGILTLTLALLVITRNNK